MGTIICSDCESTLGYFESEKVTVLYGTKHECNCCETSDKKVEK